MQSNATPREYEGTRLVGAGSRGWVAWGRALTKKQKQDKGRARQLLESMKLGQGVGVGWPGVGL